MYAKLYGIQHKPYRHIRSSCRVNENLYLKSCIYAHIFCMINDVCKTLATDVDTWVRSVRLAGVFQIALAQRHSHKKSYMCCLEVREYFFLCRSTCSSESHHKHAHNIRVQNECAIVFDAMRVVVYVVDGWHLRNQVHSRTILPVICQALLLARFGSQPLLVGGGWCKVERLTRIALVVVVWHHILFD